MSNVTYDGVFYLYVVHTDSGSYFYDQDLRHLPVGDSWNTIARFSFDQEVLAPADDWEEWALTNTHEDMVANIRMLIKAKMKRISADLQKIAL